MVNFSYLETILVHPTRRQSFAGKIGFNFLQHLRPCHMLDLLYLFSDLLDLLNLLILPMQGFAGAAAVFLQCKNPCVY